MLCVATLPLVPVKLLGLDEAVESLSGISWAIGALLIFNGIMLIVSDKIKSGNVVAEHGGYLRPLGVGVMQALLGVMPGISRSGSTILGAILLGVGRGAGAEFSFFLAIPTMLGASALKFLKFLLSGASAGATEIGILVVGCVVSFLVSLLVIKGLMEYVRKHSFSVFGIYRIILGIAVIGYFIFN